MRQVGISMGDPCGIGPELVAGLLSESILVDAHLHLYGSARVFETICDQYGLSDAIKGHVFFHSCGDPKHESFQLDFAEDRAELVLNSIREATRDALEGRLDSLVTAPIDKKVVQSIEPTFMGHTGFLAKLASSAKTVMVLDNQELRVALMTEHIPLRDVASQITEENLRRTLKACQMGLEKFLGLKNPRVAVAGVNPHAGEIGHCPEDDILRQTVEKLKTEGHSIEGPIAADSLFGRARGYTWDLILSPYHDQGLVAAKYPGIHQVVNITLGLPFLRISPGHGVAYDCVGTNKTDHRSFRRAFDMALKGKLS